MKSYRAQALIKEMRIAYQRRLLSIILESDIYDNDGNIIIKPGLKVRHKASQYEYTVIKVDKDQATGKLKIHLRSPESPRFEPSDEKFLGEDSVTRALLDTIDSIGATDNLKDPDYDVLVIDEKEFESEYEVK